MIEFKNVSVSYGKHKALKNINLSIEDNKITVLLGKNGSGKSTLVSCFTDVKSFSGEILVNGVDITSLKTRQRAKRIAVLPQILPSVPLTVFSLVSMGRSAYLDIGKNLTEKDEQCINNAITAVGVEQLGDKPVSCLSGGERQKAYIAMMLCQDTEFIAFDEPATYLDIEHERQLLSLFKTLKQENKKTLLVVMHNLERAVEIADNIIILHEGGVCFCGSKDDCIKINAIEKVFSVKRIEYTDDGQIRYLFK